MSHTHAGRNCRASSVLEHIRGRLADGDLRPGAPLVINDLATLLGVSPTPVREALARLAGEGLVVERRGLGFFAAELDAAELMGLFDLEALFAAEAVRRSTLGEMTALADRLAEAPPQAAAVFAAVIAMAGDPVLRAAHDRVAGRLAPVRRLEAQAPELEAARAQLLLALERGARRDALRGLARWADRRRKAAARLAGVVRRGS